MVTWFRLAWLLFILFLASFSGTLYGDYPCFDKTLQLPKGSYLQGRCGGGNCFHGHFSYNDAAKKLELVYVVQALGATHGSFESKVSANMLSGTRSVSDPCFWVKAGFNIDMYMDATDSFDFILIPPQPEPAFEIRHYKVIKNTLGEDSEFLSGLYADRVRSSCSTFKLYVHPDLILYQCEQSFRMNGNYSLLPFFYQYQKESGIPFILENLDGTLKPVKAVAIKNRAVYLPFDYHSVIEQKCAARKLQTLEAPGIHMCHLSHDYFLSPELQASTGYTLGIDPYSDYAVLVNCGNSAHLDVLFGVSHCFRQGLKLGFQASQHRLYCEPEPFRDARKEL